LTLVQENSKNKAGNKASLAMGTVLKSVFINLYILTAQFISIKNRVNPFLATNQHRNT
jgi:hypothetical protein